ncbi:hypothetical protein ABZV31_29800 [Streptomyces sp. NPDC005202]|uniref:hypothetical protein n=1 Tax=Streptomyces sp. NPDC005202 TaxID=3157021 RepID=UPI0033AF46FC
MTTNVDKPSRPGLSSGRTNEFTLIFDVKPGEGQQIREIFQKPGFKERSRELAARVGTLHDLRWVLFDDDKRLLFATNFDGDWDAYIDDFGAQVPEVFDAILGHVVDYPGIKDPSIKDFVVAHQTTAVAYFRSTPDATTKEIQKALRVQEAFQHLLDEAN